MRTATLLFLVKEEAGRVTEICLAMKKRGFGMGRWNGVGGKVNEGETIEDAARREAEEEIGVVTKDIEKVGEIVFTFAHKPDFNQVVHVYCATEWEHAPSESEEMSPRWFSVEDIPYTEMWPDDIFWLPKVIEGNTIAAAFTFGHNDEILEKKVEIVGNV